MDPTLIATLAITVLTAVFAAWRTQKIDDRALVAENRAASRDTVEMLARQNESQGNQIAELRVQSIDQIKQIADLRIRVADCETTRAVLLDQIARLAKPPTNPELSD